MAGGEFASRLVAQGILNHDNHTILLPRLCHSIARDKDSSQLYIQIPLSKISWQIPSKSFMNPIHIIPSIHKKPEQNSENEEEKRKQSLTSKHHRYHRFSTSKICIAPYATMINTPEITPSPITSIQRACVLNPNALRIDAPGTSMSKPYLWSTNVKNVTSLTISASNP